MRESYFVRKCMSNKNSQMSKSFSLYEVFFNYLSRTMNFENFSSFVCLWKQFTCQTLLAQRERPKVGKLIILLPSIVADRIRIFSPATGQTVYISQTLLADVCVGRSKVKFWFDPSLNSNCRPKLHQPLLRNQIWRRHRLLRPECEKEKIILRSSLFKLLYGSRVRFVYVCSSVV